MENKEIIKKYSITKKTAVLIMMQMVLIILAMGLSIFGIVKSIGTYHDINRIIVYGGQALTCFAFLLFGTYYFNKKDTKYFRSVVYSYALLEAVRVSLLKTGGVEDLPSFIAKFIMVLLVLDAALLSDRTNTKDGFYLSLTMVGLEIILYMTFLLGFPVIRTRVLFMALPFVGILMSAAMCLFVTGRIEQKENSKPINEEKVKTKRK